MFSLATTANWNRSRQSSHEVRGSIEWFCRNCGIHLTLDTLLLVCAMLKCSNALTKSFKKIKKFKTVNCRIIKKLVKKVS